MSLSARVKIILFIILASPLSTFAESPGKPGPLTSSSTLPPKKNYTNFIDAVKKGSPFVYFRLRNEDAQQTSKKNAYANTLATRLGYQTAGLFHFSGLLEFTNTTILGSLRYNSGGGTSPQYVNYVTINDPRGTRVDQAFLEYDDFFKTDIKAGRQRIQLDNQRFIGNAGWRQTEQTFDSATLTNTYLRHTNLFYGYIGQVNRVWGPNGTGIFSNNTNYTHLINGRYDTDYGSVTGYGYFIKNSTTPNFSTKSLGLRFNGNLPVKSVKLLYTLEYAHQNNVYNNPVSYSANYTNIGAGINFDTFIGKAELDLQREELGGSNTRTGASFRTPYATFHNFQGWAELFTTTPNAGVADTFVNASITLLRDIKLLATYHNFRSSAGSMAYGEEIDFEISKDFTKYFTGALAYANFGSKNKQFPHTQNIWLVLNTPFA